MQLLRELGTKNAIKFVYNPLVITVKIYWDNLFVNIWEAYCNLLWVDRMWIFALQQPSRAQGSENAVKVERVMIIGVGWALRKLHEQEHKAYLAYSAFALSTNLQAICQTHLLINSSASLVSPSSSFFPSLFLSLLRTYPRQCIECDSISNGKNVNATWCLPKYIPPDRESPINGVHSETRPAKPSHWNSN